MHHFKAQLHIIGINPFVFVPEKILALIFQQAGKSKGYIPVHGMVSGQPYKQTLVRYAGEWRLYINTTMLRDSPRRIGEVIEISIGYDPETRVVTAPRQFVNALSKDTRAKAVFDGLSPYRQKEIVRYLANLKINESLTKI